MNRLEEKQEQLEIALTALQDKLGDRVIHRLGDNRREKSTLSTGYPDLDAALGRGGLPTGRITEILGCPSSGVASIAWKIAVNAQRYGGMVLFFDHLMTFDPEYASFLGVDLEQLILIQPRDYKQGALIFADFVISGGIKLIILDADLRSKADQTWAPTIDKLIAPLGQSDTLILFLTFLPRTSSKGIKTNSIDSQNIVHQDSIIRHYAAVRLLIQRTNWIIQEGVLEGYQSQITILKNKTGPSSKPVNISIPIFQPNTSLAATP